MAARAGHGEPRRPLRRRGTDVPTGPRVCLEGPTGILKAAAEGEVVSYNRSLGEVRLSNGARIHALSADEPDRVRGLNLSGAWVDELASCRRDDDLWRRALVPAVRIAPARIVVTTTPRPTASCATW